MRPPQLLDRRTWFQISIGSRDRFTLSPEKHGRVRLPAAVAWRRGLASIASFISSLVGLVGAATVGVFFGIAFSLLPQSEEKTVVPAGPALPGAENPLAPQRVRRIQATHRRKSSRPQGTHGARIRDRMHLFPRRQRHRRPRRMNKPTPNAGTSNQSRGHLATRRGRSAHHHPQPLANAEKQRISSAAIDRAHRENFSDPFQSLTPPRAGARNSFDQLITRLTAQAKPVRPLTPP